MPRPRRSTSSGRKLISRWLGRRRETERARRETLGDPLGSIVPRVDRGNIWRRAAIDAALSRDVRTRASADPSRPRTQIGNRARARARARAGEQPSAAPDKAIRVARKRRTSRERRWDRPRGTPTRGARRRPLVPRDPRVLCQVRPRLPRLRLRGGELHAGAARGGLVRRLPAHDRRRGSRNASSRAAASCDAGSTTIQKPSGNRQQRLRGKALEARETRSGRRRRLDVGLRAGGGSSAAAATNGHRITMGAVIGACCKCGDLTRGLELLQQLDGPGAPRRGRTRVQRPDPRARTRGAAPSSAMGSKQMKRGKRRGAARDSKIGVGRTAPSSPPRASGVAANLAKLEGYRDEMRARRVGDGAARWRRPACCSPSLRRVQGERRRRPGQGGGGATGARRKRRIGEKGDGRDGYIDSQRTWNGVAKAPRRLWRRRRIEGRHRNGKPFLRWKGGDASAADAAKGGRWCSKRTDDPGVRARRPDRLEAHPLVGAHAQEVLARTGDEEFMFPDAVSYTTTARAEAAAARGYTGADHQGGLRASRPCTRRCAVEGPPPSPVLRGSGGRLRRARSPRPRSRHDVHRRGSSPGFSSRLGCAGCHARAGGDGRRARRASFGGASRERLAERRKSRDARKDRRRKSSVADAGLSAKDVAAAAAVGGAIPGKSLGFISGGPAVEAEVVMCEAEAKAAAAGHLAQERARRR